MAEVIGGSGFGLEVNIGFPPLWFSNHVCRELGLTWLSMKVVGAQRHIVESMPYIVCHQCQRITQFNPSALRTRGSIVQELGDQTQPDSKAKTD